MRLRAPVAAALSLSLFVVGCGPGPSYALPSCPRPEELQHPDPGEEGSGDVLILIAQAVPSATYVPCLESFPVGWSFAGQKIESGRAEFWLFSDRAGERAVTVTLTETCDVSGTKEVPTELDEAGTKRYEEPLSGDAAAAESEYELGFAGAVQLPAGFRGHRYYVFPGGCVIYRFAFDQPVSFAVVAEATEALGFVARSEGVKLLGEEGLILCGAGVDCPG